MLVTRRATIQADQLKNGNWFRLTPEGPRMVYLGCQRYRLAHDTSSPVETLAPAWTWVYEVQQFPEPSEAYLALMDKSIELGWPAAYENDLLIHDRRCLADNNPPVFGWSVRECGTHIMLPNDCYGAFLTHYLERGGASHSHEFYWTGRRLIASTPRLIRQHLCEASCSAYRRWAQMPYSVICSGPSMSRVQSEIDSEVKHEQTRRLPEHPALPVRSVG